MFASAILTQSLLIGLAAAAHITPRHLAKPWLGARDGSTDAAGQRSRCDLTGAVLPVPPNQNVLVPPTGTPAFVALGVGTQNYTCSSATSKYTSAGAVAELFDISCLYQTAEFSVIQDPAYAAWIAAPPSVTPQQVINFLGPLKVPLVLGQHYFITNPITGTGLSPKWDFTSASYAGDPDAFVVAAKTGDLPAPTGPTDVDWLMLNAVQGKLAKQLFRIYTKGGTAPSSCTPGSDPITVRYVSQYWLYGSSLPK